MKVESSGIVFVMLFFGFAFQGRMWNLRHAFFRVEATSVSGAPLYVWCHVYSLWAVGSNHTLKPEAPLPP
jgi:hypothetical protein